MPSTDCIFCKIIAGVIPSTLLYSDDDVVAFEDIHPLAPTHFLIIPKEHIETLDDVEERHQAVLGKMLIVASRLAREKGIQQEGYRQVINCREHGGQIVYHLHLHVLGGRPLHKMG